jgi:CBS domain-containing protein
VMTAEVHTVGPGMHPSVAARLMVNHRLVSLPVMEEGKVIGVISRIDLLGHLKKMENPLKRED